MPILYRKTEKGRAEIETRAHRLPPRLRQALIVVDGNRRDDDLARLIPGEPAEVLANLLDGGFIEIVRSEGSRSAASASGVPTAAARPAAAPASGAAAPAASPSPASVPFPVRRREVVRALMDAVGPFGEPVAMRIEKAADEAALRPLIAMARQSILANRGAAAADAFARRFQSEPDTA